MKQWLITPIAVLALAQAAMAFDGPPPHDGDAPPPPPHGRMFKDMDANGDGVVTKKEALAFHEKKFDEIDANKDGKITKEEAESFAPPHPEKRD